MPIRVTISPQLANLDKRLRQRVAIARNGSELAIEIEAKQQIRAVGAVASEQLVNSVRVLERTETTTRIGSDKPQAKPVEEGRKPGKVPKWSAFKPILKLWVQSKGLGIPDNALYAVARKIALKGFKGRWPFRTARQTAEPKVVRIFKRVLQGL